MIYKYKSKIKGGNIMIVKILGTGCKNCKNLEANAKEAIKELGLDATVEKVEDMKDIMSYGVMRTPALVVDEKVKVMGRVSKVEEIKEILQG